MALDQVLFISEPSEAGREAAEFIESKIENLTIILWKFGDSQPKGLEKWTGNWIFSFKSDLILSSNVLSNAKLGAINFHPASPDYRGIGGEFWAVKERAKSFGATCHHMVSKIDYGPIILVKRFPLNGKESPLSLKKRADNACMNLFRHIVDKLMKGKTLPNSEERWKSHLHTRSELDNLRFH